MSHKRSWIGQHCHWDVNVTCNKATLLCDHLWSNSYRLVQVWRCSLAHWITNITDCCDYLDFIYLASRNTSCCEGVYQEHITYEDHEAAAAMLNVVPSTYRTRMLFLFDTDSDSLRIWKRHFHIWAGNPMHDKPLLSYACYNYTSNKNL